jgi:hypothetical protein
MRNIRKKVKESRNIDTEMKGSLSEPEIHNRSRYGSAMKGLQFFQLLNELMQKIKNTKMERGSSPLWLHPRRTHRRMLH